MIVEACVETFEEALLAEKQGANRIELCSDLDLDGLTPSFELMRQTCSNLHIPVMVMIRPRGGNFVYSEKEIIQMQAEIDFAKKAGASGVVFGLLTENNKVDKNNTRRLAEYARPLPVTYHKAIDVLEDQVAATNILKNIKGIRRILTSGGKPTALEGQATIREMIKAAEDKIIILVAGKVLHSNLKKIQEVTGATEFHGRRIVGELDSKLQKTVQN